MVVRYLKYEPPVAVDLLEGNVRLIRSASGSERLFPMNRTKTHKDKIYHQVLVGEDKPPTERVLLGLVRSEQSTISTKPSMLLEIARVGPRLRNNVSFHLFPKI
jgi:hypothetical protein